MARGIKRLLRRTRKGVAREISNFAARGGKYAAALAAEGYNGGYRDALDDISLALDGVKPSRNGWWDEMWWGDER